MRNSITILFILLSFISYSQKKVYKQIHCKGVSNILTINFDQKKSSVLYWYNNKCVNFEGDFKSTGDHYLCKIFILNDVELKLIDKYRIQVINSNFFFKKNEIVYCYVIRNSNDEIIEAGMNWENGLRSGVWEKHNNFGIVYTIWQNGTRVRTYFKTHKQLIDEWEKLPCREL